MFKSVCLLYRKSAYLWLLNCLLSRGIIAEAVLFCLLSLFCVEMAITIMGFAKYTSILMGLFDKKLLDFASPTIVHF